MFRRPRRPTHTIDMAPLIDVVFLLLVFFMLTSSFVPPSLPLILPEASAQPSDAPQVLIVSRTADGVLAIGDQVIDETSFVNALRQAISDSGTTTVHFRGDRSSQYGDFLSLMSKARAAGAVQLNLIHSPEP